MLPAPVLFKYTKQSIEGFIVLFEILMYEVEQNCNETATCYFFIIPEISQICNGKLLAVPDTITVVNHSVVD